MCKITFFLNYYTYTVPSIVDMTTYKLVFLYFIKSNIYLGSTELKNIDNEKDYKMYSIKQ